MIGADDVEPFGAGGTNSREVIFGIDEVPGRLPVEISARTQRTIDSAAYQ